MLLTTTHIIEGKPIKEYRGLVFGEVISGINFLKDFTAGLRNFFGGRSKGYEDEILKARQEALDELSSRAEAMGANAVVGIKIDHETIGDQGSYMLMTTATGAAVII